MNTGAMSLTSVTVTVTVAVLVNLAEWGLYASTEMTCTSCRSLSNEEDKRTLPLVSLTEKRPARVVLTRRYLTAPLSPVSSSVACVSTTVIPIGESSGRVAE